MEPHDATNTMHYAKQQAMRQQQGISPPPMSHTESTTNSLQSLLANLNNSNAHLQEVRDRMFGVSPESASKEAPRPVPNGRADEIDMILSACHTAAERNSTLAGELLRRL